MSISDPIADFITCIRNAAKAKKETVTLPASKMKVQITEILRDERFITNFKVIEEGNKKFIRIYLKYLKGNRSAIKRIKKVSTPGLRRYVESKRIPRVLNGLGIIILSTSKGIITGEEARKQKTGGEMICTVY